MSLGMGILTPERDRKSGTRRLFWETPLMAKKTIANVDVAGKKVLMRVDFNVPDRKSVV